METSEISCRITNSFIHYVRTTRPEFLSPLLRDIPYTETYLTDNNNWIPWTYERMLEERLAELFQDENIMFQIGRSVFNLKSLGLVNLLGNLFLSPERLIKYTPKIARYFTKEAGHISVLNARKGSALLEIGIKGRQTRGACLYNQGLFSVIPEFFGLPPGVINEHRCMAPENEIKGQVRKGIKLGAASCIFELKWEVAEKRTGFFRNRLDKKLVLVEAVKHLEENHRKLQQAYERVSVSERRYFDLMENAGDIIVLLDKKGEVTFVNKKGLEISGYPLGEIIGKHFSAFLDEESIGKGMRYFNEAFSQEGPSIVEVAMMTKDLKKVYLSVNSSLIMENESPVGLMVIARDITKDKEMSQRLIEAEKFAAKGIIAAEIAHEINNSLANIETALFILKGIKMDSRARAESLKEITDEIERMSGIVSGILDVYRPNDNTLQSLDINAEIANVIGILQRKLSGKGIALLSDFAPDLPPLICYEGHLKQVLLNVIKNSIEALESGNNMKMITISTKKEDKALKVAIEDTGPGIPEEIKAYIFSPLYTTKEKGIGLGLDVCLQIMRKYNGSIEIRSADGKGATVELKFPL